MTRSARTAIGLLLPVLFLGWWAAQGQAAGVSSLAFASPGAVVAAFAELGENGQLLNDALATLLRALSGLAVGATAGIAVGTAMAMSRTVDRLIGPLYHSIRQVPLLGWLPLIGLWLGNGDGAKLLIVSLAAFYPSVLNTYEGLVNVERRYVEVGQVYGFSARQRFVRILLPAALPLILTGVTQALAFAWIATIGTEILLGSGRGLGATMSVAQGQARMDIIIAAILVTALMGFAINQLFLRTRQHLLRWQTTA